MKTKSTPLLELLEQRWKLLKDVPDPSFERPFKRPEHKPEIVSKAIAAVRHHSTSDPFAVRRAAHYIRQGYDNPFDVLKDNSK